MAIDFRKLVFFGDSLTDDGNLPEPARPDAPYVGGRFTNGPVHAQVLARELGVGSDNFALGGAEASTNAGDDRAQRLINLPSQVSGYLASQFVFASLGSGVSSGTAAAIFIGSNDILNDRPDTRGEANAVANRVASSIASSSIKLVQAGAQHIVFYTLPYVSYAPDAQDLTPTERSAADAAVASVNKTLKSFAALASALFGTTVVDVNRLETEIVADRETFGLEVLETPLYDDVYTGLDPTGIEAQYSPDEVAFFDPLHPTATVHAIIGAFSEATLRADKVTLRGGANDVIRGSALSDLVFSGAGDDRVSGSSGNDVIFAGLGNDRVNAGQGSDLVAGGSGDDVLYGKESSDLLAGNAGNDVLFGGSNSDILVDGTGFNQLFGESGNDAFIFTVDGTGTDVVSGGSGADTLFLRVSSAQFASSAFQTELQAYGAALSLDPQAAFTFGTIGLSVDGVERLEVSVDGTTEFTAGRSAVATTPAMAALLKDAALWNLV